MQLRPIVVHWGELLSIKMNWGNFFNCGKLKNLDLNLVKFRLIEANLRKLLYYKSIDILENQGWEMSTGVNLGTFV